MGTHGIAHRRKGRRGKRRRRRIVEREKERKGEKAACVRCQCYFW